MVPYMIEFHLALLIGCVVVSFSAVYLAPSRMERRGYIVGGAMLPFLIAGACSMMWMETNDFPTTEWVLPALAAFGVVAFCGSKKIAGVAYFVISCMMLALLANFFHLVHACYTSDPIAIMKINAGKERLMLEKCKTELESQSDFDGPISPGTVSSIFNDDSFDQLRIIHIKHEWHTPMTRLWRVESESGTIWTEGGLPAYASRQLHVVPTSQIPR